MMKRTVTLTSLCLLALTANSLEASDAYLVRNLVSDIQDLADYTDPNLQGAWGISESATSPFWIANAGSGTSTLYGTSGAPVALVVAIPPSKGGGPAGSPTGTVYNGTSGFAIASGAATPFLFATFDGTIQGWSPAVDRTHSKIMVDNSASGAEYFGLAMATADSGNTYLYAANFHSGAIDIFDSNYKPVAMPGGFRDPDIPSGWAPFNIQNIGGNLYVAFAKQNASHTFSVSGPGLGFVDVFAPNGVMIQQLIVKGPLNAPWGLAKAPAGFGDYSGNLLVGNFGDGTINAFDPKTGDWIAELKDPIGAPITIPNLWALQAGNGASGGEASAIYFTAGIPGPDNGNHGLFGRLHAAPQFAASGVVNGANPQGGIAPNTWIAIKGMNLAETTRNWNPGDFVNGDLPIDLDNVRVLVNDDPAYVYFVSPTQVNILTSTDLATGPAQIQVNNNGLVSTISQVQVQALAPALFTTDGKHVMATHADGTAVGTAAPATPAKPGETIWLSGTGFGPTNPEIPDGKVITTPLPLATTPTATVAGVLAQVTAANLTSAGLYQIAVTIPASTANGDAQVIVQVGDQATPPVLIPVQR